MPNLIVNPILKENTDHEMIRRAGNIESYLNKRMEVNEKSTRSRLLLAYVRVSITTRADLINIIKRKKNDDIVYPKRGLGYDRPGPKVIVPYV